MRTRTQFRCLQCPSVVKKSSLETHHITYTYSLTLRTHNRTRVCNAFRRGGGVRNTFCASPCTRAFKILCISRDNIIITILYANSTIRVNGVDRSFCT